MDADHLVQERADRICAQLHRYGAALPKFHSHRPMEHGLRVALPANGLYLFFEVGEQAEHLDCVSGRIVRVRNNEKKQGALLRRLARHYTGTENTSVLLRQIGGAMLRRDFPASPCLLPGPGEGHFEKASEKSCPTCRPLRARGKKYVKKHMEYSIIPCFEMAERNRLEKILIAAVSLCRSCEPSKEWLGQHAYSDKIKKSGLWQIEDVFVWP